MKVPICMLCHKIFDPDRDGEDGGDWLTFADYRPLGKGAIEGPPGMEWFCRDHIPAALSLSHLTSEEALIELERQFGKFPKPVYGPIKLTWWQWLKSWIP